MALTLGKSVTKIERLELLVIEIYSNITKTINFFQGANHWPTHEARLKPQNGWKILPPFLLFAQTDSGGPRINLSQ